MSDEVTYSCGLCGERFSKIRALNDHCCIPYRDKTPKELQIENDLLRLTVQELNGINKENAYLYKCIKALREQIETLKKEPEHLQTIINTLNNRPGEAEARRLQEKLNQIQMIIVLT